MKTSSFDKLSLAKIKLRVVSLEYFLVKYLRNFSELLERSFWPSGGKSLKWLRLFLMNRSRSETLAVLYFLYLWSSESITGSKFYDQSYWHLSSILSSLPSFSTPLTVGWEAFRNSRWSLRSMINRSFLSWDQNMMWESISLIGGLFS